MTTEIATMTTNKSHDKEDAGVGMLHHRHLIAEGDSVIIYVAYGSTYAITVTRGQSLHMKYGTLR